MDNQENIVGKKYVTGLSGLLEPDKMTQIQKSSRHFWGSTSQGRKLSMVMLYLGLIAIFFAFFIEGPNLHSLPFLFFITSMLIFFLYLVPKTRIITEITFFTDRIRLKDLEEEKEFLLKNTTIYKTLSHNRFRYNFMIKYKGNKNLYSVLPTIELENYIEKLPQTKDIRIVWFIGIPILMIIIFLLLLF
ncbi:MAG: hypothetical protein WCV58_01530 [Patescibacteria group bacterium]|jgi:hypothetical protein